MGKQPKSGERQVTLDPETRLVTAETMTALPEPYQLNQYGHQDKKVAITFDDGPDPNYTPQILDVLKREQAPATFFLIGLEVQKFPGLAQRIYEEGHAIGNHTFTHPDISEVSQRYIDIELNVTERLFASKLGVKPLYFRPPYSIDQEPDIADQVRPIDHVQNLGFITIGSKIDPDDWQRGRTVQDIVTAVMDQAERYATNACQTHQPPSAETSFFFTMAAAIVKPRVQALPQIIDRLREAGFQDCSCRRTHGQDTRGCNAQAGAE